ncbi:MAG: hypothetical protein HZA50_09145 [Planctomycetes bacterium]|nr:hypothetical protein [Planctomycetota bacterium]
MKTISLCGLAVLLSAGCNPELDQYHQIELGKPLANRGVLAMTTTAPEIDGKSHICSQGFLWPLPSIWADKTMRVLTDNTGNVIAKHYVNQALEHFLVAQLAFMDWRLELQVPPEYFHETPPGWKDITPGHDALQEMEKVLRGLSDGLPKDECECRSSRHNTFSEYICSVELSINPNRLKAGVIDRITEKDPMPRIDIHKDLDLEGIDTAKIDTVTAEFRLVRNRQRIYLRIEDHQKREAKHIAGYMAKICDKFYLGSSPQYQPDLEKFTLAINFGLCLVFGGIAAWPDTFENHLGDLKGLTQDGFERTIEFGNGGFASLRNFGERKIQIEYHFCQVYDPIFARLLLAYIFGSNSAPIEKTTINKIGN